MANYTETTNFTALTTAQAVINGAAFDLEYGNIAAAIATKFDNLGAGYTGPFKMNSAAGNVTLTINGATGNSALQVLNTGIQVGTPTGGDQGAGTINATAYYVNGVLSGFPINIKSKAAATSRTTNTTPTNDPDLNLAITAAGTYKVEVIAGVAASVSGFQCNLNYSGSLATSPNIAGIQVSPVQGTSSAAGAGQAVQTTQAGTANVTVTANMGTDGLVLIEAIFAVTTTGTVGFSWAQQTSNASATTVNAGSTMTVTRIA